MDWNERNCCHCRKYVPDSIQGEGCPIEEQIAYAAMTDGKVPEEFAIRMGYLKDGITTREYTWPCAEFKEGEPGEEASEEENLIAKGYPSLWAE